MPTKKSLNRYPSEYRDLFLQVEKKGLLRVAAGTSDAAQNLRRDLYNYRLALWQETPRPPTKEDQALLDLADLLVFRVRGTSVIITRNESVYQEMVKRTLEELANETQQ